MKLLAATIASLALFASSARAEETKAMPTAKPVLTRDDVRMVTPALDQYTQDRLLGDVWKRPGLSSRDRSIITLSALIARSQTIEMPYHFNLALDNGVKPREISEIITHLAFYAGWANAMSAVAVAKDVFAERKIGSDQLPAVTPLLCRSTRCGKRNVRPASESSSARPFRESVRCGRTGCRRSQGDWHPLRRRR
jgi:4-carboxymuconolactone decarboxylase